MDGEVNAFLHSSTCRVWELPEEGHGGIKRQRSQGLVMADPAFSQLGTCLGHGTVAWGASECHSAALERLVEVVRTGSLILPKMVIL